MGCIGSKTTDEPPRQRVNTESTARGPAGPATGTPGNVAIKNPSRLEDNFSLARSPHDARFEERDYFKNLVEHTASNLIDVSQAADFLTPPAAEARHRLYEVHLRAVASDQRVRALSALPEVNLANANAAELLDAKPMNPEQLAWAMASTQAINAALASVRVSHGPNLVVALPEMRAQ
eukprot:c34825_g1_i1.p1 GENE.c34825_g1_i1~~c34825_g1_i1.p1  ORF type:complete len:178 (+),score=18.58 c34825_g1_i1:74-607(+)